MEFSRLVKVYERLEATSKRLEMTDILVDLLKDTAPAIIDKVVYLTQGRLYPSFVGIELGVADKLALKALSFVSGETEDKLLDMWVKEGDLGKVAQDCVTKKRQRTLFSEPLTVERVYGNLEAVAKAAGSGAQDMKVKLIGEIVHDSGPVEAKYIMRMVVGKLRLGIADMTIIDALAQAFGTKEDRERVEATYNISSDLGAIARALAGNGVAGLDGFRLRPGIPIRPMLAERLPSAKEILEKMDGRAALEYKYDGLRVQAHIVDGGGSIRLFSRQLEDITDQFPDVAKDLKDAFTGRETIAEGECVPINIATGEMLPFQEISHRRGRKYEMEAMMEKYPVALFLFDCLFFDGKDLLNETYEARRNVLAKGFRTSDRVLLAESFVTTDPVKAEAFFEKAISSGCEGMMAKMPDSKYKAGARGWQWIKCKRDYKAELTDTLDLVVVGAISGQGKRKGAYGALLMAAYDPDKDMFETVCKLGTGFSDAFLIEMKENLADSIIKERHPRVDSTYDVDVHFAPKHVLEVAGAEITLSPVHTCAWGEIREDAGLAVRFPRYTGRWRVDKGPEDATTTKEFVELYMAQRKKVD